MSYYFNAVPRLFIFTLKLGLLGNPLLKINAPHEKLLEELSAIAWLYMWFNYNRAYLDVIWQKKYSSTNHSSNAPSPTSELMV